MHGRNEYWAACKIDEMASKVVDKFNDYKQWMEVTGYAERIRTSYQRFYAIDQQGGYKIERDFDDIDRLDVNHFKSLIRRMHNMVTENKLAYQTRAMNSDVKSLMQADIGRSICDYYGEEKNMNGMISKSVLGAIVMFEQFIHCPWSLTAGYELAVDGQKEVTSGDQAFEVLSAFNCARSVASEESQWYIVRQKVNKFDEATLYPDFADEIILCGIDRDRFDLDYKVFETEGVHANEDDFATKYIFYHERTPAMPDGRWTEVIGAHVLRDGPLTYDHLPIARLTAGKVIEQAFADSPSIDLLGIQEGINALFSAVTTNGMNNAKQLIYCQDPALVTRRLDDGQTLVSSATPPQGLNLSNSSGETFKLIDMMISQMQLLSGINDVARGNASANLKSGVSLAVILAQAIQYVSDIQKSYARVAGEVGTILLKNIRQFGPEELIGYISGSKRKGQVKTYKRSDLMDIDRVTVDLGNPLTQTLAGRAEIAQNWAQMGIMVDPKQIEVFMRTGEIDQVTDDDFQDTMLIMEENEQIKQGKVPIVLLLDNHVQHIIKHKATFASTEARSDPAIVEAGLSHINEHISMMRMVPPDLASIISGQGLPPPPQEGAPQGPPPPQGNPEIDGANMPSMPDEAPEQTKAAYQQSLNAMPRSQ